MHCGTHVDTLTITLSDKCNIKCAHCIVSAGPLSKAYSLSSSEVRSLGSWAAKESSLQKVHFVGGEPTLCEEIILALQANIGRSIKYAVTTNGWLGKKLGGFIDRTGVTEVTVSYDEFHATGIEQSEIQEALNACLERGIPVVLKVTVRHQEELSVLAGLSLKGVDIRLNKLIKGGRWQHRALDHDSDGKKSWGNKCPVDSLVYLPGRGLAMCCGPLAFDRLVPDSELFFGPEDVDLKTSAWAFPSREPFASVAGSLGIDTSNLNVCDTCDACTTLYSHNPRSGLPSLYQLAKAASERKATFPITQLPSDKVTSALQGAYSLRFLFSGVIGTGPDGVINGRQTESALAQHGMSITQEKSTEPAIEFLKQVVLLPEVYSPTEQKYLAKQFDEILPGSSHFLVYRRGEDIVAILSIQDKFNSSLLQYPTVHILALGLDRVNLSTQQRRAIRHHWRAFLSELAGGREVSGYVDSRNQSSLNHAAAMGRCPKHLVLERKP